MKKFLVTYRGVYRNGNTDGYFFLEKGSIGAVTRYINEAGEENTKGLKFDVYDVTNQCTVGIINRLEELTIIKTIQY